MDGLARMEACECGEPGGLDDDVNLELALFSSVYIYATRNWTTLATSHTPHYMKL